MSETVVVLGASPKEDRYSNQAVRMLLEHGHDVIPVHPTAEHIHGADVVPSLDDIREPIDTLTLYLSPPRSLPLVDKILKCHPKRVILNPGTESPEVEDLLESHGILVQRDCTLVLLRSDQF